MEFVGAVFLVGVFRLITQGGNSWNHLRGGIEVTEIIRILDRNNENGWVSLLYFARVCRENQICTGLFIIKKNDDYQIALYFREDLYEVTWNHFRKTCHITGNLIDFNCVLAPTGIPVDYYLG